MGFELKPGSTFGDLRCVANRHVEFGQHPFVRTFVVERQGQLFFLEATDASHGGRDRFVADAEACREPFPSRHFREVRHLGQLGVVTFLLREFHAGAAAPDLFQHVSAGTIPSGVVEAVFLQALQLAVEFAPGAGNLVGGLEDLVLGWDGRLSVPQRMDWLTEESGAFRSANGWYWFISPEEAQGRPIGASTATWHAAAMTYLLFSGRGPFSVEPEVLLLRNIIDPTQMPPPTSWMQGPLLELLNAAFDRDMTTRPIPHDLVDALKPLALPEAELGAFFSSLFVEPFRAQTELMDQVGLADPPTADDVEYRF